MTQTLKRIGLGIGATAVAVIIAGASYQNLSAQGPGPGGPGRGSGAAMGRRGGPGGPGGGVLGPMMLGRLNLTSDQRDRVRQIMDSHREEQQALGTRAVKAHQALEDAVTATFDESAIRARSAEIAAVQADMAVAQAHVYGEIFQVLTSDQQQTLTKLQADMKSRQEQVREDRAQRKGQR